jgi:hypothetical protein
MDYYKAFVKLYGAAGAALDMLWQSRVVSLEMDKAKAILQQAIHESEDLIDKKPDGA